MQDPHKIAVKIGGLLEANASGWLGVTAVVLIVVLVLAFAAFTRWLA